MNTPFAVEGDELRFPFGNAIVSKITHSVEPYYSYYEYYVTMGQCTHTFKSCDQLSKQVLLNYMQYQDLDWGVSKKKNQDTLTPNANSIKVLVSVGNIINLRGRKFKVVDYTYDIQIGVYCYKLQDAQGEYPIHSKHQCTKDEIISLLKLLLHDPISDYRIYKINDRVSVLINSSIVEGTVIGQSNLIWQQAPVYIVDFHKPVGIGGWTQSIHVLPASSLSAVRS
jgi:hypothetical protein